MTTKILPQEFHFEDTSDSVRVKTAVDRELVTDKLLLPHIRHFRLGAGTVIKVQIMSKDYDVLLHTADFVISRAVEAVRQVIDERGERTARVTEYKVVQDSDWKSYETIKSEAPVVEERKPEIYVPGEAEAKWNPGRKTFEIKIGDEVLATERNKERALRMAAGSEPLPA